MKRYIGKEELALIGKVIDNQQLWRGEDKKEQGKSVVAKFEKKFASHLGVKYVRAVNSGTTALQAALAACDIGPGDEVICTAYSFIASSLTVLFQGATPVFADVDPRTLCLDPDDIKRKITKHTKAVIPVHIFGQPCRMDEIMALAKPKGIKVIEDCCQAYDSLYKGRKVGTIGDLGCFSLQQSKHITSGEGGIVVTNDRELYRRVSLFSNVGMIWDWPKPSAHEHFAFGGNYRMGELQGAVALAQLGKINKFNAERKKFVRIIEEGLRDVVGINLAYAYEGTKPNYWVYPLRFDSEAAPFSLDKFREICGKADLGPSFSPGYQIYPSYLEPVYQNKLYPHRCLSSCPLSPKAMYHKGLCPVLEKAMPYYFIVGIHHGRMETDIRKAVNGLRKIFKVRAG